MVKIEWSKPFYGVTHLSGIPKRYRITINGVDTNFSIIQMFDKDIPYKAFTPIKVFRGTKAECRKEGEKWAKEIGKGVL